MVIRPWRPQKFFLAPKPSQSKHQRVPRRRPFADAHPPPPAFKQPLLGPGLAPACTLQPASAPRGGPYALSLLAGRHAGICTTSRPHQPAPPCGGAGRRTQDGSLPGPRGHQPLLLRAQDQRLRKVHRRIAPAGAYREESDRRAGHGRQRTDQARGRHVRRRRRERQCVVKSYLQWLRDSDFDATCSLCRKSLQVDDVLRLTCLGAARGRRC